MSIDKAPSNEQDIGNLDFTESLDTYDPAVKIAELTAKIASTERGIRLAQQLKDEARISDLQERKNAFEKTILTLQAELPKNNQPTVENKFDVADMSGYETGDRTATRIRAKEDRQ